MKGENFQKYLKFKPVWIMVLVMGGLIIQAVIAVSKGPVTEFQKKNLIIEAPRENMPMGTWTGQYARERIVLQDKDGNHDLTYFWLEPRPLYATRQKYPLVVVLHGSPGLSYAGIYLTNEEERRKHPAYVMVPVIPNGTLWDFPSGLPDKFSSMESLVGARPMMSYVVAMIYQKMKEYPDIDPNRIYVIGCSQGGFGVFGAALRYPDVFAAGVAISGGWLDTDAAQLTKMPLWVIHGLKDTVIPVAFSRDVTKAIQALGGPAIYTQINDMGHSCPNEKLYGPGTWNWLFSQSKATP